ncbi:hypothetical protein SEA_TOMAS_254 [Streptomyces phage Tomas]|uniref:Uncharacterized protein n=1 Tax=Streptomyces phage Tomas TaxID=2914443 RepID=A0AA49H3T4_9CAUD|nr:hypothetical protein PP453_gp070 [Streptomyces phage Tomas]UMO76397.1 hypothetical protein SEA_TOMAS_254 [Streptomyces phage Tomas]
MRYTIVKEPLKRGRKIEAYNYAVKDTLVNRVVIRYENQFKAEFIRDIFNEANVSSRYEFEASGNESIEDLDESAFRTGE